MSNYKYAAVEFRRVQALVLLQTIVHIYAIISKIELTKLVKMAKGRDNIECIGEKVLMVCSDNILQNNDHEPSMLQSLRGNMVENIQQRWIAC